MSDNYQRTDTMRIKISGNALEKKPNEEDHEEDTLSGLDLINRNVKTPTPLPFSAKQDDSFEELLDSVYDAVLIANPDGQIIKCNDRAITYFHAQREDILNTNIIDIISGADDQTLLTIYETLSNKQRIFIEAFCNCMDQSSFPAEVTVSILHLAGVEKLCFFIRNVTMSAIC